jgi:hypothetical protein
MVAVASDVPDLPGRLARFLDGRVDGRSPDLTRRNIRPGDRCGLDLGPLSDRQLLIHLERRLRAFLQGCMITSPVG